MKVMRINANDTAVLVVDYQEKLLPAMSGLEELMDNSKKLLKGLKNYFNNVICFYADYYKCYCHL